jgi:predicted nuclease of restriction endonuclease-like (RecB) superfamily
MIKNRELMDKEINKSNGQLKPNNDETQLTAYNEAVTELKTAILQSQLRVAKAANTEMLSLYYAIGKYLSNHTRKDAWGTNAIEVISRNLQKSLPGLRGFSSTNMRKMRIFYEQWSNLTNCSPSANELQRTDNKEDIAVTQLLSLNHSPMANDLDLRDFFSLSFSHHYEILSQTKTLEERIFYIHQAAVQRWDKYTLRDNLRADLFHHQGQMPNNFMQTIPERQQALKAIEMFKDEYLLDYINVEELGCREEDIDERVIENSIVHNIKNFIMTFGKSFSYLGHQVHYEKLGEDHWVDLLFFNRELRSLVVVELKRGAFKPSYLGQLQTYLRILDDDERLQGENPSVGIILCRDANRAYVEYVLQDYRKPMGVATYQVTVDKLKSLLPNEDEMRKLLTSNEEDGGSDNND